MNQYDYGFKREDFGPGLITAGLSMLANNDGRMNVPQLIGQGGLDAIAGLQFRKQMEAQQARQQMLDEREKAKHDMLMQKGQFELDEASRRAELMKRWQAGDQSAYKMLFPEQWAADQREMMKHRNALALEAAKQGAKGEAMPKLTDVSGLGKRWTADSSDYLATGEYLSAMMDYADEKSGAGDLGLIFSYMKMLDPNSVVREGEQVQAVKTSGIDDQLWAAYQKVFNGEKLTSTQRRNFIKAAQSRFRTMGKTQGRRNDYFRGLADAFNIDPALVIADLYSGLDDKTSAWLDASPDVVADPPVGVPGLTVTPSHGRMDYSKKSDDDVLKEAGIR